MKLKIFLIVAFTLVMGSTSCKNSSKRTGSGTKAAIENSIDNRGYIVKVGDMAPDFEIEYLDGRKVKLSDLRGKLVMIQFTASWCSVCRKEMPHIENDIWLKHKDNSKFALVGIDLREDKETTEQFAKDMDITYPLTLDITGEKFELFTEKKAGVTRNIIVDKSGKIIMLTRLFEQEEFDNMVKLIDEELKKM